MEISDRIKKLIALARRKAKDTKLLKRPEPQAPQKPKDKQG